MIFFLPPFCSFEASPQVCWETKVRSIFKFRAKLQLTITVDSASRPANSPVIITKLLHVSEPSRKSIALDSPGMSTVYWRFSLNFVYSVMFLSSCSIALRLRPCPIVGMMRNKREEFAWLKRDVERDKIVTAALTLVVRFVDVETEIWLTIAYIHARFDLFWEEKKEKIFVQFVSHFQFSHSS